MTKPKSEYDIFELQISAIAKDVEALKLDRDKLKAAIPKAYQANDDRLGATLEERCSAINRQIKESEERARKLQSQQIIAFRRKPKVQSQEQ